MKKVRYQYVRLTVNKYLLIRQRLKILTSSTAANLSNKIKSAAPLRRCLVFLLLLPPFPPPPSPLLPMPPPLLFVLDQLSTSPKSIPCDAASWRVMVRLAISSLASDSCLPSASNISRSFSICLPYLCVKKEKKRRRKRKRRKRGKRRKRWTKFMGRKKKRNKK